MVNRIGGLASGMDIDALVAKLMAAERTPLTKLQQKKQTTEWTRDAYRSVNAKLKTFDTWISDNLLLKGFNSKTATTSNSSYVSATATSKASGSLSIEGVSQLAKAANSIGKQINATGDTKLSDLPNGGIKDNKIELKAIQSNGKMATEPTIIEFDPTKTTVSELVEKINNSNAGVSALFENGSLSITAKNTGDNKSGAEVEVLSGADVFVKLGFDSLLGDKPGEFKSELASGGKNAMFKVNGIATERSTNSFSIAGYNLTLKSTFNATETINSSLTAAYAERKNAFNDYETLKKAAAEALGKYNTATINHQNAVTDFDNKIQSGLSDTDKVAYNKINNVGFFNGLTDEEIIELEKLDLQNIDLNDENNGVSNGLKEKLKELTPEALEEVDKLNKGQLESFHSVANKELSYINANTNFLANLKDEDYAVIASINWDSDKPLEGLTDSETKTKLGNLKPEELQALKGLSSDDLATFKNLAVSQVEFENAKSNNEAATNAEAAGSKRLSDARASVNAAREAAGLAPVEDTDDVNGDAPQISGGGTPVEAITITSSTDVDDMMNKIEEFVTMYNGLVKDLNDQTKDKKYRDYAPLTDEQRKEMSENEIKLWEEKAKSGLLRSDSIIRSGLSDMRGNIYESNPAVANSKFDSLFKIGITGSKSYNDGGTLEIDKNKLRKAIEEDPDAITALFTNKGAEKETITVDGEEKTVNTQGFLQKLRGSMKTFSIDIEKKAGLASSVDNSYTMGKNLVDMDKRIDTWKTKLEKIEARYWKQFNAMEQAINKANSQSGMFAQFGGQG